MKKKNNFFNIKKSQTNSGFFLNFLEKNIRTHPLLYYIMRSFVRFTNIFEEDANGVKFLNLDKEINLIDVGASDGIATKFFCRVLNVKNAICFEPNKSYVKQLKKLNINNLIVKPYALANKNEIKKIFFPRYKFFSKNLDLIPYTYYDKETLISQFNLDFKFLKNIQFVEKKLYLKKLCKINFKIDLIKIDVNDNGLSVVKSLLKIIKKSKPVLLIETDSDIKKIDSLLKIYGYVKYSFLNYSKKFKKIKNKFPLNTYFLQNKHLG